MIYKCSNCGKEYDSHKRNQEKHFCSFECYSEFRKREYTKKFKEVFDNTFEVVEFDGVNVVLKCNKCGHAFARKAKMVWHRGVICWGCREMKRKEERQRNKAVLRLIRVIKRHSAQITAVQGKKPERKRYSKVCVCCGQAFETAHKGQKYCTSKCGDRLYWKNNEIKRARNIKANGVIDKDISLVKLYERDKGICYLCGKRCDYKDFTVVGNTFIAGNDYPSIEHIKPISKGGAHSWDNVRLAHRSCNSYKGSKTIPPSALRVGENKYE